MRALCKLWPCLCSFWIACSGARNDQLDLQARRDAGADAAPEEELDAVSSDEEDASSLAAEDAGSDASPEAEDAAQSELDATTGSSDAGPTNDAQVDAGPARIEAYVNADTGNDQGPGSSAAPLKTLRRAFEVAGENGLVLLQPSTFNSTSEGLAGPDTFTGRSAPAGTIVRAVAAGVRLGVTLQFPAGGAVEGVSFDSTNLGRIMASGGTLALREVTWLRTAGGGISVGLELSGSANVTLEPGSDPMHDYLGSAGEAPLGFAMLRDQAELRILGGVIDGASGAGVGNLIDLAGSTKLTLRNVTISNQAGTWVSGGAAVWMGGANTSVLIESSRIDLANAGGGPCLVQDDNYVTTPAFTATLTIRSSVLTRCAGSALQLREDAPEVRIENSELSGSSARYGIETGRIGFDGVKVAGRPRITLIDTVIRDNYSGGITMNAGGSLTIQGGSVTVNGRPPVGAGPATGYGGLYLAGVFPYTVSLRSVRVTDNYHFGNYGGLDLAGDEGSSFDLGSAASPGNNMLTGSSAPQLRLRVAANVRVSAVGNTWLADQGADTQGHYTGASGLCASADPCDQSAGSGANFAFTSAGAGASLRLYAQ